MTMKTHFKNKKLGIILLLILSATIILSTIGSVSAAYSVSDNGKIVTIDISSATSDSTIDLGNGQKIRVQTYFLYAKRMVVITAENTPKILNAYIAGRANTGLPYTANPYYAGGAGSFFTLKDYSLKYESFREGGTPHTAYLSFAEPVIKSKATDNTKADLKISKITKKGNYRYVTVKNVGKAKSGKNQIGVYVGKKLIKKANVKALKAGQSTKIKVGIPKKYVKKSKTFHADYRNVVSESKESNNKKKAK